MKHISEILPKALEELLPKTVEVKNNLEAQKRFKNESPGNIFTFRAKRTQKLYPNNKGNDSTPNN